MERTAEFQVTLDAAGSRFFSLLFLLSFERHHVQWVPSLRMLCMMRLLARQLPILLQFVQLWVVLGRLEKANATVEEETSIWAKLKCKGFQSISKICQLYSFSS